MTAPTNIARHKILLLDDDPDVLDLYQEMLLQLPSEPEVQIATTGVRAIELLEAEPFTLLVSDLKMPKMDGLQVLSIVRRRFPILRTVVLTGVADEQLRSRAYSMGIDLFLEKPSSKKELKFLLDCIESLLDQEVSGGFRGVQSKSLVDIIQLECLSGNSALLKITRGKDEGKIWIQNGDVIDAAAPGLSGEQAFGKIMSWKSGNFELLPSDPEHPRVIHTSYQGLLLDSAQAMDEAEAVTAPEEAVPAPGTEETVSAAGGFGRIHGLEFAVKIPLGSEKPETWAVEDTYPIVPLVQAMLRGFARLGENAGFGRVESFTATGMNRHLHAVPIETGQVVAGMVSTLTATEINDTMKKVLEQWDS